MTTRVVVILLWLSAVMALLTGVRRYQSAMSRFSNLASPVASTESPLPPWPGTAALHAALERLNGSNSFEAESRTTIGNADTLPKAPPLPPQAQLVVQGIVGGPPWSVVVSGIPTVMGPTVLRPGDSVGGVSVVRIGRDSVVLRYSSRLLSFALKTR